MSERRSFGAFRGYFLKVYSSEDLCFSKFQTIPTISYSELLCFSRHKLLLSVLGNVGHDANDFFMFNLCQKVEGCVLTM